MARSLSPGRGEPFSRRRFMQAAGAGALALALGGCSSAGAGAASGDAGSSLAAGAGAGAESGPGTGAGPGPDSGPGSAESAPKPSGTLVGEIPESAKRFERISTTLFVFDTVVTLAACCDSALLDQAADRCRYFESIFSRTIADSDIGRINAAGGARVEVAPETADVIAKALAYCEESDGLFDITIGAVSTLWDFKEGVIPDAGAIEEALPHVDYRLVDVSGTSVTLDDSLAKLDLGGIAKGYIADDLASLFLESGCDCAYVNLGGNVKTVGVRPDGRAWHVGIQDPNDVEGAVVAAVYSQDTSIVTSGLYERQFTAGGRRYWHILDPRTGYPVETDLVSATIISDASLDGDGYTKPLFMMGRREALAWMDAHAGIEGMVVGSDGAIDVSAGCGAELL